MFSLNICLLKKSAIECIIKKMINIEKIVDAHCHLNDEKYIGRVDEIITNAKENSVSVFLVPSWDIESSKYAIELANSYDNVYASVSIHAQNVDP